MSWLDKIKSDLIIKTGDGKEYRPLWINAIKEKEYNISEFEFINISGALVTREKPKAARYALQIFFQGEDHIDVSRDFERSADDHRAWTLTHPYYGLLIVQPAGLNFDNTNHNVSEIKGTVIETITEDFPKTAAIPQDKIATDVALCDDTAAADVAATITAKGIEPRTISKFKQFIDKVNSFNTKIINALSNTEEYFNALSEAQTAIDSIATGPLTAMKAAQSVISAPAMFEASVKDRITALSSSFTDLTTSAANSLGTLNLIDKFLYQANSSNIISAMCLAAATPQEDDFGNRDEVINIIDIIINIYNIYINTLDSMQTTNGGAPISFIPTSSVIQQLSQLVNYTVSNLFNIALDAKQQRSIILEDDSNWILLAHRFYGLLADDSTVDTIMRNNNAGLNSMLQVPKNTKIIYYT